MGFFVIARSVLLAFGFTLTTFSALSSAASAAEGAEDARKPFDIPAGTAPATLKEFSAQAGGRLLYNTRAVEGVATQAVKGEFTAQEALERMLADTPLVAVADSKNGALSVVRDDPAKAKNVNRAIAESSARPEKSPAVEENAQGEKVLKLETFEVFGRKTLNMDIRRTADDPQPYIVFDSNDVQHSGASNLTEFFQKRLTVAPALLDPLQSVSPDGNSSQLDIRGLGSNQTLILINGRRAPSFTRIGATTQPDLNTIPLAAVERIEILPTTGSGIYGGGATGGVINVILKRDYPKTSVRIQDGHAFRSGGDRKRLDVSSGFELGAGRTKVSLFASYAKDNGLQVRDRAFYTTGRAAVAQFNPAAIYNYSTPPLGSTTNISSGSAAVNLTFKPAYGGAALNSPITFIPVGYAGIGASGPGSLAANAGKYNLDLANTAQLVTGGYGGLAPLRSANETKSARLSVDHDFSAAIRGFFEASGSRNFNRLARNVMTATFTIPAAATNNPFNQSIRVTTPTFGADQNYSTTLDNYSLAAGLLFKLPKGWNGEFDYNWSQSEFANVAPGTGIKAAGTTAVQTGAVDVLRDTNQFPVDFSPYLQSQQFYLPTRNLTQNVTARVAGPIVELPAGPVVLSFLAEHRQQDLGDSIVSPDGGVTGQLYPSRGQHIESTYVEGRVPLIGSAEKKSDPILEIQLAGRYDDYTTAGGDSGLTLANGTPTLAPTRTKNRFNAAKPTVAFRFKPHRDLAFRASYGEGFLPPATDQLVPNITAGKGLLGIFGFTDPLRGNEPITSGDLISGGNPNLVPEESTSYSGGVIYTPKALSRLRISVDWTKIEKRNNITTLATFSPSDLINEKLISGVVIRGPVAAGDPFGVGKVIALNGALQNALRSEVEVIDYAISYGFDLPAGQKLELNLSATQQLHNQSQGNVTDPLVDRIGVGNNARWNTNAQATWTVDSWEIGWSARYLDFLWFNLAHTADANTGRVRYGGKLIQDIFVSRQFTLRPLARFSRLELQAGISNLFNTKPDNIGGSTYFDGRFDPTLSSWWLRLSASF